MFLLQVPSAPAQPLPILVNPAPSSLQSLTATMTMTPAAVDDVSRSLQPAVSMTTQPVILESGCHHCFLQKDVAVRVSDEENIIFSDSFFCITTGVVTSPNYPNNYPYSLDRTDIIWVEEGLIIAMQFTAFDVEFNSWLSSCDDHVTIKNGDGTSLMEKTCGSSLPAALTSKSNVVKIYFHSNEVNSYSGWSLTWRAVTPGAKPCFQLFSC